MAHWKSLMGLAAAVLLVASPPAQARHDPVHQAIERLYAKFLSGGRGDVEIQLSPAGLRPGARTEPNGDGSFTCHVFGLQSLGGDGDQEQPLLVLAGTLLHEATHCQVTPYAMQIRPDPDDPASVTSGGLVLLALECISDARAVLELYRRDGLPAAQQFAAYMLPRRVNSPSLGHSTAAALRAAMHRVSSDPDSVRSDAQAFAAAIEIGRRSADYTFQRFMRGTGRGDLLDSAAFKATSTALDAALQRAVQAFQSGRYDNNAATLRVSDQSAGAGDYHFYVGIDGTTRAEPALGTEGARQAPRPPARAASPAAASTSGSGN